MSCNDSIPMSDIVAAVAAQLSKQYVASENGVAKDLTLKDGVTLDSATKRDLCEALENCINDAITDDYLTSAALNGETLVMNMKSGKQITVPLSGLGDDVSLASGTVQGNNLVLTKNDGTKVTINLEQFANTPPAVGNTAVANDGTTVLGKFLA